MIKHTFCVKISTTYEKASRDIFRDFLNKEDEERMEVNLNAKKVE